jgi:hypothetical protein
MVPHGWRDWECASLERTSACGWPPSVREIVAILTHEYTARLDGN